MAKRWTSLMIMLGTEPHMVEDVYVLEAQNDDDLEYK